MEKNRRTILLVGPLKTKGGISFAVNAVISQNISDKYKFRIVNTSLSEDGGPFWEMVTVIRAFFKYLALLLFTHVSIVHIHSSTGVSFYRKSLFVLLARLFRRKIVYHIRSGRLYESFCGPPNRFLAMYMKFILRSARTVVCFCEYWEKRLKEEYLLNEISVIPNAVGLLPIKAKVFSNDIPKLLFIGSYKQLKGVKDLLEVARSLVLQHVQFQLHLCGRGSLNGYIDQFIEANCLGANVENVGWVEDEKKINMLANADIFVFPSYTEGMPNVVLEAMAYGLPVVGTTVSCLPSMIENGKSGFLVRPGDKEALLEAILKLINDKSLREQMSKNSLDRIQEYLPQKIAAKWDKMYQEILSD